MLNENHASASLEQAVDILHDGVTLSGSLTRTTSRAPDNLIVMIHGSGPLDRNENGTGLPLNVFNHLAKRLSDAGISSFRYDKRGCGTSTGNYPEAGHFDLVEDACAVARHCRENILAPGGKLYLLGHSEGCVIAPQVAQRTGFIDGLILLCPFIQPLRDLLLEQARQLDHDIRQMRGMRGLLQRATLWAVGGLIKEQSRLLTRLESSTTPTLRYRSRRLEAKWFREMLALDPRDAFSGLDCPILAIAGAKDLQCPPEDVHRLATLYAGPVEAHILDDLTHILRRDDQPASFNRYDELLGRPTEPRVSQLIIRWLEKLETSAPN